MEPRAALKPLAAACTLVLASCGGAAATTAPEQTPAAHTSDCGERSLHRGFGYATPPGEPWAVLHVESSPTSDESFGVCPGDPLRTGWSYSVGLTANRPLHVSAIRVDAAGHVVLLTHEREVGPGTVMDLVPSASQIVAPEGRDAAPDGVYGIENLVIVLSERPISELDEALGTTLASLAASRPTDARLGTRGVPVIAEPEGTIAMYPDEHGIAVMPFWWALVVGGSLAAATPAPEESIVILTE